MTAPQPAGFLPVAALMFVAGIGIPIFAAFNAALGKQLGSPLAATAVGCAVGLAITLALLAVGGFPQREAFTFQTPHLWFGIAFFLIYATSVAFAAPRIGLGNAIFFVLLGQIFAAAAIDNFGWFGVPPSALTLKRVAGLAVMGIGIYLARKPA